MIKKFHEFLNESQNSAEYYFSQLRKDHSKSPFIEGWIEKISNLLNGKIESLNRSEFRKSMGEQFGLELVDNLVAARILKLEKQGRKEVLFKFEDNSLFLADLETLKGELGGEIKFDERSCVLTIEKNFLSSQIKSDLSPNEWAENAQKSAEKFMKRYYSAIQSKFEELDYNSLKIKNHLASSDFLVRYSIKIKGLK